MPAGHVPAVFMGPIWPLCLAWLLQSNMSSVTGKQQYFWENLGMAKPLDYAWNGWLSMALAVQSRRPQ